MKTIEKIILIASILIWIYCSVLIHIALIESRGNFYENLLFAACLSFVLLLIFIGINMLAWGAEYQERISDEK